VLADFMAIADKPRHLQADYAEQFLDESVAAAYPNRPPYPEAVIDLLSALASDEPRVVLELGAGTGDITRRLAARVTRVDAVEPSVAMRAIAAESAASNVRWIADTAEAFVADAPYALVVAAESLHWMDWNVVLPKIAHYLTANGLLAVVTSRALSGLPWAHELRSLIAQYSTNHDYTEYDIIQELTGRGLFQELGRQTITGEPFSQSIDAYVESFHSRNGFSRLRMPRKSAEAFDAELRALVLRHQSDAAVKAHIISNVVWGRALAFA
jgi:SAM-dependent methyltransferase